MSGAAVAYAAGVLIFGSLNALTMKAQFLITSEGLSGDEKPFAKPWFGTLNVFTACVLVLLWDIIANRCRPKVQKSKSMEPLICINKADAVPERPHWWKCVLVLIPASIDVGATGFGCIGMVLVPASVWQMLRGAMIIFAAIFSVTFLGKKMFLYGWFGVTLCVAGVATIGAASIVGSSGKSGNGGQGDWSLAFGIGMILFGQVLQAGQMVLEEWLLKTVNLPALQVIGWEGLWGFLIIVFIIFPMLYVLPGDDGGHMEDPVDTFVMIKNSLGLLAMVLIYTFSCATYNVAGIKVTEFLSSVHRVLIEASRTVCVWGVNLFIHYVIDPNSPFGEVWTPYSFLQLFGFILILAGQATHGGVLRWPCFYYPPPEIKPQRFGSPVAEAIGLSPMPDA